MPTINVQLFEGRTLEQKHPEYAQVVPSPDVVI